MTAEALSSTSDIHLPEYIAVETLTHETYNGLLAVTRELHDGARVGQTYGDMEVQAHSENHTQMTAGHEKLVLRGLIFEEIPHHGLLFRNIQVSPTTQGGKLVRKNSILLNSFAEQPRILRTASPILEAETPVSLAKRILAEGEALDERTAKLLTEDLQALRLDFRQARYSRVAGLVQKLKPWSW